MYDHLADPPVLYLCQMWVIEVEDVEDADIKRINDEWNHDGEEGDAGEHTQQSQPSYKQQEHWRTQTEILSAEACGGAVS